MTTIDESTTAPAFDRARFTCPACHQLADQVWLNVYAEPVNNPGRSWIHVGGQ